MQSLVEGALVVRHTGDPASKAEEMVEVEEELLKDILATPWISSK